MAKLIEEDLKSNCVITRSRRKTVAIVVHQDNSLEVRCPLNYSKWRIHKFLEEKSDWIRQKQLLNEQKICIPELSYLNAKQLKECKQILISRIDDLLIDYNGPMPEKWTFRRQKSRWGSCSSKRQISINLHAIYLPEDLFKYLIMHEIVHLVHMNHGKSFWEYLESFVPDARRCRKRLNHFRLPV